jgi:hypothetical protein
MKKELLIGIGIGALVVALFTGANASSLLFGLLILACPLMMVFMMGGHGHGPAPHEDRSGSDELTKSK